MGFVSCTVLGSKRVARFFFILYKTFIQLTPFHFYRQMFFQDSYTLIPYSHLK